MCKISKRNLAKCLFALLASIAINAHALVPRSGAIWLDDTGAPVAAPAVLNGAHEGVFFTETETGALEGFYNVTNNTVDYRLLAFGVSNNDSIAWVESIGNTFGCFQNWCYESGNRSAENWDVASIDFSGNTGQAIFGDINNVLDPGDNTLNFYIAGDGDLGPGDSWDGFIWSEAPLASQMFVVLEGFLGDTIYGYGIQPTAVPVPAAIWLFGAALATLRLRRK